MARLAELLLEWEERREAGEPVTAQELCAHEPELLDALQERIGQLERFQELDDPAILPPRTPTTVGGYPVKRVLGAGATGIVYLAKDRTLGRKVAVKVLSPRLGFSTPDERRRLAERFKREARLVAKLSHPAIVPIYEAEPAWRAAILRDGVPVRRQSARPAPRPLPASRRARLRRLPRSWPRWRAPCAMPMRTASCTATSSQATSCSMAPAGPR